jgi:hypothetical protein
LAAVEERNVAMDEKKVAMEENLRLTEHEENLYVRGHKQA